MDPLDTRTTFALDLQGMNRLHKSGDSEQQLQSAAEQFEALLLHQLVKSMRDAVPRSDLMDSSATRFYESLFDQQLSTHLAGRGLGLAQQLVDQLSAELPRAHTEQPPE